MKKTGIVVAVVAVLIGGGLLGWMTALRLRDARGFGAAHRVQTFGGTNYVVRVRETTIGRTDAGLLAVVALRLENPNPFELTLERRWFVLVDAAKNYFLPAPLDKSPNQIKIPPHGVADNELLTYAVQDDAFQGVLGLQIGHYYWTMLKGSRPYPQVLNKDEYRTFRRRDW